MRSARLLTLVGPGGCGKSRLALELAGGRRRGPKVQGRLVELDPLRDGGLLSQFIAAALQVAERGGRVTESLVRALSAPGLVLVLDNCEHLAEPCARLTALLLRRCPGLRIVATSREALRVPGEVVFRVGELTLPAGGATRDVGEALRSDAVRLFVERARACAPEFELTSGTVEAVTEICRRLDGLPLAIELAARRVAGLPLAQILAGLDDQLSLLTDGNRIGPARHRELAAAIEWSHRLLDPAEQAVFRRVSILVGGFDIAGARAVCAADEADSGALLRLLCALEAKSLLVRVPGEEGRARFRQLSAIRAYGLRRLSATGELPAVRERVLTWLSQLTTHHSDSVLTSAVPPEVLAERENLAAAVSRTTPGDGDRHVQLAVAMARVHRDQSQLTACRTLLMRAVRQVPRSRHRSEALALAARAACLQHDHAEGLRLAEEAVAAARGQDQSAALVDALDAWAFALVCGRQVAAAVQVYRECLTSVRTLGRPVATAVYAHRLAWALQHVGAVAEAQDLLARWLPVLREQATPQHRAAALHTAGALHLSAGGLDAAEDAFLEVLHHVTADSFHAMYAVEGVAIVAAERGDLRRALRLTAAAAAVRERIGVPAEALWQERVDAVINRARSRLGATTAEAAAAAGRLLHGPRLISHALGEAVRGSGGRDRTADAGPLTEQELQIAVLVADGLNNGQVAERLNLSPRTVAAHLDRIREKLGLRSRTRIALWVAARGDSHRAPTVAGPS